MLQDAYAGRLQPLYNYMDDLPGLEGAPIPMLPAASIERTAGVVTSFDAGRGCPFQCSFCTIINVQGRKSRFRSPDDVEAIVRANLAQGIDHFFITDDNLARNKNWEPMFDRLIAMRAPKGSISISSSRWIRFATASRVSSRRRRRRGCGACFSASRSINPESLVGAKKKQNRIAEYRAMLLAWKAVGCFTYAGYILGFPGRHAGDDRARHQDHPARVAARSPRILLPDAAAGLGGPQEIAPSRGLRWTRT